jgi:hypothetical protein
LFFPLQFSTAYTILWKFAEYHGFGGGVDEAAGVNVRRLAKESLGTTTSCEEVLISTIRETQKHLDPVDPDPDSDPEHWFID